MRFLVDENLPVDVADILRRADHDVLHVSQSDHRGALDKDLWRLAADEGRIVVTRDLDFPLPDTPKPPGLILLRVPDTFRRNQIKDIVAEFVNSDTFSQVEGAISVVSPGRVRSRVL